jgi:hypothetical protein
MSIDEDPHDPLTTQGQVRVGWSKSGIPVLTRAFQLNPSRLEYLDPGKVQAQQRRIRILMIL